MNERYLQDPRERPARLPEHYGLKLTVTASLGWVCAWLFLPGTFVVWMLMVGVYSVLLAAFGLATALGYRGTIAQRQWRQRFFRTSGWLVMSGVLSIVLLVVLSIIMRMAGQDGFSR